MKAPHRKRRLAGRLAAIEAHAVPLAVLLAVDCVFIALHVVHVSGIVGTIAQHANFAIDRDRGYAEIYEYIKLFGIALGLGWLAWRQQQELCGLGGLLFAFLGVDNVVELHEQLGTWFAEAIALEDAAYVLGSDAVQVAYWGAIGVAFVLVGRRLYRRSSGPTRRLAQRLLVGLVGLALFGVVVDTIHSAVWVVTASTFWDELLALAEDGGELMVMSWMGAVVLVAVQRAEAWPE